MAEQISAAQRHKLKAFIKVLKGFKGRHTELVSVYVPEGYDMNKITAHLAQEQGTASNIKSKQTRDNVIAALERMLQQLKLVQRTPSNGLAAATRSSSSTRWRRWSRRSPSLAWSSWTSARATSRCCAARRSSR